jgi:homocysteine S-methyltransferase
MTKTKFAEVLQRKRSLVLDGGLATQLEAQGYDIKNALWSASLLQSDPEAIVDAHRAYLEAGAQCIETASYQASREGFSALGLSSDEADDLMRLSVDLAQRARAELGSDALIAASLGPYGAMLHDGSEYTGDYDAGGVELCDYHAKRMRVFDGSDVDVLAFETIPSLEEARVLAELLQDCATPAWISFSCKDETHICDGTDISEAAVLYSNHPNVLAVGINCTAPQYVPALIRRIRSALPDMPIVAYPNSGEIYNAEDGTWSGTVTPVDCAAAAASWLEAGAIMVGGCCRMGPEHIKAMAATRSDESNIQ